MVNDTRILPEHISVQADTPFILSHEPDHQSTLTADKLPSILVGRRKRAATDEKDVRYNHMKRKLLIWGHDLEPPTPICRLRQAVSDPATPSPITDRRPPKPSVPQGAT
ncbi:hypothetical protein PG984_007236 [Apiospora sp. TS-2023a]